jgi:hypothetical protein
VRHVEFAEKFDDLNELDLPAADEILFEQLNLDLIGGCLAVLGVVAFFLWKAVALVVRLGWSVEDVLLKKNV